jgi:hypothetical protein
VTAGVLAFTAYMRPGAQGAGGRARHVRAMAPSATGRSSICPPSRLFSRPPLPVVVVVRSTDRGAGADVDGALAALMVQPSRGLVVLYWRWRTELVYLTLLAVLLVWLADRFGYLLAVLSLAAVVGGGCCIPPVRLFLVRRWGRLKTRHGMLAVFRNTRMYNRAGRFPLILGIACTPVGERVKVWLRPGLSAEHFEDRSEQFAAACWARDVRVSRSARFAQLVTVDVIRRDPLAATAVIGSPLPATIPPIMVEPEQVNPPAAHDAVTESMPAQDAESDIDAPEAHGAQAA